MFFTSTTARFLHIGRICLAAEKSALATLRKKTGYTFSNCKKALELHNNDLALAEKWLREQAQALGWSKATKLEGRATAQGLIGLIVRRNIGAMIEVNCETDFVARNAEFQAFVARASQACLQYISALNTDAGIAKIGLEKDALHALDAGDGKPLGDHLALLIGTVGENATLKRAIGYKVPETVTLLGYVHPASQEAATECQASGKYGAIAAFNPVATDGEVLKTQKQILQHIVGMNPTKLGDKEQDERAKDKDEEQCLIFQEFLLDPDVTVGEVMEEQQIEVIDFQRLECGEMHAREKAEVEATAG